MSLLELSNKKEFRLRELPNEEKARRFDLMVQEMEITLVETPRMAQEVGKDAAMNDAGGFKRLVNIAQGLPSGRP